ncbi:CASP8-associated protein 2 [Numida meleagris]|uniref:CASP8-associated protein 2 n=1 Tax=Numida meleagris TaxID=8996 RepID=UPI000B3E2C6A|nr:CASP8-associated protein 2 [Numida meleagris]XP_021248003.1 CASP8-associated protein 2 [Numida meleagris]XP_021248004.1 CASP8-associated protein 2 [Numida meleagris]
MAADEDGLGLFDTHCAAEASPFKEGDESSVDIYDGLDNGLTIPDNSAPNSAPAGNSLNLFDEILIEEGTAKEASYNELQAEYGKCQQQIKELMKKFKEIQAQNIILQNENQALKKNISALIKTARVEINRKDEEISNLHQRLSEFPNHRSNFTRANLPGSTNGRCSEMCKTKDYKFRSSDLGDSIKTDHRMKNDCPKDTYHSYSSHSVENGKSSSDKRNTPYVLRYPPEELCSDGTHICPPNHDHSSSKDNKKEKKETKSDEQYSRGNVNKYKREVHQSNGNSGICNSIDSEEGNSDPHQKLKAHSDKASKNELQQRNQNIKVKCSPSTERKVEKSVSSWDKQTTGKDRCQVRGELYAGERSLNVMKKDIKVHDKDEKNSGQKIKPNEKLQEQSRRSGRGNSPYSKNEHSKTLHESRKCRVEESRTGRDIDCKRDRGANDHSSREGRSSPSNSSSREHKYTRFKENSSRYEWETAHSKSEKHRTEEKRKRERENQDENRHSRSERKVTKDVSHQSAKKAKKDTDVKSERNKSYKSEETPRVADSLKDHKFPQSKNHSVMKSKDLKLSFMEKLNLTLSPAKKQCLSSADGLKAPSQMATGEGTTELTLHADMVDSAHLVNCGAAEQMNSTLQVLDTATKISVEPTLPVSVNSENEALKVAAADPAQSEALSTVTTSEVSSETIQELVVDHIQSQALPGEAKVLIPDEMLAETLSSSAAEACEPVESEASAVAVTDLNHPEASSQEMAGSVKQYENLPVTVCVMQGDNVPAAVMGQSEMDGEGVGALPESAAEKEDADEIWLAAGTENSSGHQASQNLVLCNLEAKSSGDLESCDAADDTNVTKPESSVEIVKDGDHLTVENLEPPVEEKAVCEISMNTSQSPDRTVLNNTDVPLLDQNACDVEQDLTDIGTTASSSTSGEMYPKTKEREPNPVPVDDDSSILSIDLNHLRHIPKAISPLNSPMRPLPKALKMESPCKGLVKSYNKDLIAEGTVVICPSKNLSKEVNKENQKPLSLSDTRLEIESQLSISSDEIEEGEIISSEDEEKSKSEGHSENPKKSRPKTSPETRNLTSSPQNQKNKTIHCNEDNGKFVSVTVSTKNRERHKNQTFRSSKEMKKNKTVSITCLEKIVQVIAEPSNVQEIMQMLRAIRKQMRKNYMKFKVHFPVQHFHRIIESAIINFTSLIKHLNFSKMSTSGETLKLNVCDIIESKLKQVKKNTIVDRLFEQQVSDMKKRLWKFVDEQLDYLFEKVKRIIVKQCDVVKLGNESEEGKLERTGKQNHKVSHKNDVQRSRKKSLKARSQKSQEYVLSKQSVDYQRLKCHHEKNKTDAPKAAFTKCLNSIDNTRNSQTKVQPTKENNFQYTITPLKGVKHEGFQQFRDANKSDLSYDLLTEQQASTLTFNLVSDAQMGEIFKSLLQGSDLLEKSGSNIDRHDWEFRTPEKQFSDNHKCKSSTSELVQRIAPKEVHVESRSVEDISWAVVSPIRAPSLTSRLQMSVDPDVLDESCMFEVPTSATSCKEDECSLQKSKSFVSSILLEDLAVSLTIPSPLKSDAHLSFLKSETNSSSTPECVLSAHYSEDALLEGEDATEQDIHLALESDNSSSRSSCSSSWTSRPVIPGFQCRSSLPMQAVIMEKSNDHFIVKIRRAVPSITPASDQMALVKEARASSTKNEKEEMRSGGKGRDRQSAIAATLQEAVKPDLVKTDQLPYGSIGKEQNPALPHPLKESHNSSGKEETTLLLGPCRKPSKVDSRDAESPSEGSGQLQTHKSEVSENTDGTVVRSQASFPVGCSVESCIDLTDESVKKTSCFAVESTANNRSCQVSTGNSEIRDKKEMEECSNAFIDLTEELSSETTADECNLEEKSTLDTDRGCQISIDDKTSKKRKKETVEENSNLKRQRKETESVDEGSNGSDVKSEGMNSGQKQCHSKNNELQQNKDSSPLSSCASSPSLYAKNIIKKKGEVVVSWTRNDDREILLECQRKGPSSKTFVSLATRLNKSPNQVSERFKQLMKLFKKSKCK